MCTSKKRSALAIIKGNFSILLSTKCFQGMPNVAWGLLSTLMVGKLNTHKYLDLRFIPSFVYICSFPTLAMDSKCLQNKHTAELLSKEYFQNWLKARIRLNVPVLWFWFVAQIFNISLFLYFDSTLIWIESAFSYNSSDACQISSNLSCLQNYYKDSRVFSCSLSMAYCSAGILVLLNTVALMFNFREIYIFSGESKFITHTLMGRKNRLGHTVFYKTFDMILNVSLISNVSLRVVRQIFHIDISGLWDNVTFYGTVTGAIWSLLFFVQLVPYIGYFAIVLKLMLKETSLFILYIITFTVPYTALFIRIFNNKSRKGECDSNWKDFSTSMYSNTLLLFNMMNFSADNEESEYLFKQAQVLLKIHSLIRSFKSDHKSFIIHLPNSYFFSKFTILQVLHVLFVIHISLMMMNFLIALLSNSLATVLKDKDVIMAIQEINVALSAEFRFCSEAPSLSKLYYSWVIPKCYILKDNKVYLSQTVVANENL